LLKLVRRAALPPPFLHAWHFDRRLANQLWALEDTVLLIVELDTKSLLLVKNEIEIDYNMYG
jgi:hypothetical protein